MGLLADLSNKWTNAVIALSKGGAQTQELAGNTVYTDRLRKLDKLMTDLHSMRGEYEKNQKSPAGKPEVARKYEAAMEKAIKECGELNKITKDYLRTLNGFTAKYAGHAGVKAAMPTALQIRDQIDANTRGDHKLLKEVAPALPPRDAAAPGGPKSPYANIPQGLTTGGSGGKTPYANIPQGLNPAPAKSPYANIPQGHNPPGGPSKSPYANIPQGVTPDAGKTQYANIPSGLGQPAAKPPAAPPRPARKP